MYSYLSSSSDPVYRLCTFSYRSVSFLSSVHYRFFWHLTVVCTRSVHFPTSCCRKLASVFHSQGGAEGHKRSPGRTELGPPVKGGGRGLKDTMTYSSTQMHVDGVCRVHALRLRSKRHIKQPAKGSFHLQCVDIVPVLYQHQALRPSLFQSLNGISSDGDDDAKRHHIAKNSRVLLISDDRPTVKSVGGAGE